MVLRRRSAVQPSSGVDTARARAGAPPLRNRWFVDSPLEGNGFKLLVPRQIGGGFKASLALLGGGIPVVFPTGRICIAPGWQSRAPRTSASDRVAPRYSGRLAVRRENSRSGHLQSRLSEAFQPRRWVLVSRSEHFPEPQAGLGN